MEDYWRLLPRYQGVELEDLELRRVLYGLFVSYKTSPVPAAFDRVLQARGPRRGTPLAWQSIDTRVVHTDR